jgi:site-specific DNA-methyltransferase (adenine-specific)
MKTLFFGDCLEYLKDLCPVPAKATGFIDLIYIDPPFNSKRDYNILFNDVDMKEVTAQKKAFADTWSNVSYIDTLSELQTLNLNLFNFLETLNRINISKSAVSYLTTMAIRIFYMHKALKDTGSFYLHCDPTMSHYLKIVCDLIFGEKNFRNEIIWSYKRYTAVSNRFQRLHDIVLFYSKKEDFTFNELLDEYGEKSGTADSHYKQDEDGKWYRWQKRKGKEAYKIYLSEGKRLGDVWDIPIINASAKERLGYPTQKPEALLERIIKASSNEGDLVADFFCGCGTSIAVSERLKRNWLGVDISHLAIKLIKKRLVDKIDNSEQRKEYAKTIVIKGFPQDVASAYALARQDYDIQNGERTDAQKDEDKKADKKKTKGRVQFQEWVVEVMLGGVLNPKQTADGGWDGHEVFEIEEGKTETVLIEVKSGNVNVKNIREFIHVIEAQKAAIGVFVCFLEQVTRPMLEETTKQGYYREDIYQKRFGKIQILTVEDLLNGHGINMPYSTVSVFKKSVNKATKVEEGTSLFDTSL